MYIQENLTTTPYELSGISWELPEDLLEKFYRYRGLSKLVFDNGKTKIIDIIEDEDKRAQYDEMIAQKEAEEAERESAREKRAEMIAQAKLAEQRQAQQLLANVDYLAMMTSINLPEAEDIADE